MRVITSKRKDGHTLALIRVLREGHDHVLVHDHKVYLQKDVNGVEHLVTQHRDGKIETIERIEDK
jgi:hypothetical protein|tara:strand:+ start:1090 stop:1284 length:195 start_codon:yes stop_codon:yes gene_type:complete